MKKLVITNAEIKYISDYIFEEQERYSEERETNYFDMELIISNAIDAINGGALDQ